eukprot:gnl/TRDRNA2_/TRDRNA2_128051_c0_seq1.p2 gnl/TRDRNA2_/TRDRNA2_128051_c0~~gnl/TRDRNA2_/TRDRNA2_128051_c0_seq1.p2  ORF type:complete len:151 (-),score=8.52 gnl/TRDRNA2_/TRDRNA2_128051_c0_seq1:241-693(-)
MMTPSYLALVFVVLVFAHLARAEEALDPDELKLKKDYSGVHPTPYGEGYATLTWYTGMDCSQKDAGEIYTFPNNDVFPAWCAAEVYPLNSVATTGVGALWAIWTAPSGNQTRIKDSAKTRRSCSGRANVQSGHSQLVWEQRRALRRLRAI